MQKIRKKDQVIVIAGRDKGKKGEVVTSLLNEDTLVVKGVNLVKKSVKKSKENPSGGYVEVESSINKSNVLLFCPKCNKGVRVNVVVTDKGEKTRTCKKCNHKFE